MSILNLLGILLAVSLVVIVYIYFLLKKEGPGRNEVKIEPVFEPAIDLKETQTAEYKKKIEELEDELRQLAEDHLTKDGEFIAKLEALSRENDALKEALSNQGELGAKQFDLAQQQAEELNQENLSLKTQLQEKVDRILVLENQASAAHGLMEDDLAQARSMIEQLKAERDAFVSNREAALQSAQILTREFDQIKQSNESLMAKQEELRMDNIKLKELNDALIEKNKLVQMELSKYRAQASGLEKICENYKMQLSGQSNA